MRDYKIKKRFKNLSNVKSYYGNLLNTKLIIKIFNDSIKDKKYISGLVNKASKHLSFEIDFSRLYDIKTLGNIY